MARADTQQNTRTPLALWPQLHFSVFGRVSSISSRNFQYSGGSRRLHFVAETYCFLEGRCAQYELTEEIVQHSACGSEMSHRSFQATRCVFAVQFIDVCFCPTLEDSTARPTMFVCLQFQEGLGRLVQGKGFLHGWTCPGPMPFPPRRLEELGTRALRLPTSLDWTTMSWQCALKVSPANSEAWECNRWPCRIFLCTIVAFRHNSHELPRCLLACCHAAQQPCEGYFHSWPARYQTCTAVCPSAVTSRHS